MERLNYLSPWGNAGKAGDVVEGAEASVIHQPSVLLFHVFS